MDVEAIVKKYERLIPAGAYTLGEGIRAALTELSETHTIELRAYEATVANLEQRIRELEAERVPDGWIPVSEKLPPHNTHVVGLWQHQNGVTEFDVVFYEYDGNWYCESVRDPDYWCALPYAEPPAAAPQPKKEGE